MSSKSSNWERIKEAFLGKSTTPPHRLEELMSIFKRGKTQGSERLEPSEVFMRRSELLYRVDPLIFSSVNKLTRRITGSKIYFSGPSEDENRKAEAFFEESGALSLLSHLVKDSLIYGFGAAEIVRKGSSVTLSQIYPMELDYQREGGEVKVGPDGNIVGFQWRRRGITENLKPTDVLLIRFYALGEYCLGISPVEAALKVAWIKLNLEESLGEAIYRHGFPIVKYKIGTSEPGPWHDVTPEKIKEAKKILKALESGSEIILPWWMDAEIMGKRSDLGNIHAFIELLSMEILAAFEIPKGFGTETKGLGGRAVEELDFEKTIIAFQEELRRQLEEQLLFPYFQEQKFKTRPRLTFTEYSPELQNIRLRRLSAFAKYGLITRTDDLENALRTAEGFPMKKKRKRVGEDYDECIFGLGKCPVRMEEAIPLDRLASFCNICIKRLSEEKRLRSNDSNQSES